MDVSHKMIYLAPEHSSDLCTGIPWQIGLRRGSALDADGDRIVINEAGYYFVYSQVGSITEVPEIVHWGLLLLFLQKFSFVFLHTRCFRKVMLSLKYTACGDKLFKERSDEAAGM